MSLQIDFGIAIQQLRKQRGLSQERLALEADIDRRYMSDVENGKRNYIKKHTGNKSQRDCVCCSALLDNKDIQTIQIYADVIISYEIMPFIDGLISLDKNEQISNK